MENECSMIYDICLKSTIGIGMEDRAIETTGRDYTSASPSNRPITHPGWLFRKRETQYIQTEAANTRNQIPLPLID